MRGEAVGRVRGFVGTRGPRGGRDRWAAALVVALGAGCAPEAAPLGPLPLGERLANTSWDCTFETWHHYEPWSVSHLLSFTADTCSNDLGDKLLQAMLDKPEQNHQGLAWRTGLVIGEELAFDWVDMKWFAFNDEKIVFTRASLHHPETAVPEEMTVGWDAHGMWYTLPSGPVTSRCTRTSPSPEDSG